MVLGCMHKSISNSNMCCLLHMQYHCTPIMTIQSRNNVSQSAKNATNNKSVVETDDKSFQMNHTVYLSSELPC